MLSFLFASRGTLTIFIAVLLSLLLVFASCGKAEETPKLEETPKPEETPKLEETPKPEETPKLEETPKPEETPKLETISLAGSTSVQPLAKSLALSYMEKNTQITIDISGVNSTVGIQSAWEETVDIGMASRELAPGEPELMTFVIARDGMVVIIHPMNKVKGLSRDEVSRIFSGEINNWKDVGGEDTTITVVSFEEGSETRATFEKWVMGDKSITTGAFFLSSDSLIRANVAKGLDAISYYSFSRLDPTVKALTLDGVEATVENMKTGIYPLTRPFYFLTKETPGGEVKKFIDFCLGLEGQQIVVDMGYVPVE